MGYVDVRDVAAAHILANENKQAEKRLLCFVASVPIKDWCDELRKIVPNAKIPTEVEPGDPPTPMKVDNVPLKNIGWSPISFHDSLADTVAALKKFNHYKE